MHGLCALHKPRSIPGVVLWAPPFEMTYSMERRIGMLRRGVLVSTFTLLCIRASAQSVISTHSGLLQFFEGAISIDGRTVPPIKGRFPEIPESSVLNTNEGKAEILLDPEVFVWLDQNSAIRMQRNRLADTRVELLEGSAIIESLQLAPDSAVTLIQKNDELRLSARSLCRIDVASSQLTVLNGQAEVTNRRERLVINERRRIALSSGLISPLPNNQPDRLEQWVLERRRAIAAANLNRVRIEASAKPTKKKPHRLVRAYPAVTLSVPRRTW